METYSVRQTDTPERTMQAIVQRHYGGPEQLSLGHLPVPTPGPGEVLVQVKAAGVDRGTEHLMTGLPLLARPAIGVRRPKSPVPGRDLAGVVASVGPGVDSFAVGDPVFGTADGSFAQYAVVPTTRLAHTPAQLDFPEAAVLAISGLTALEAVTQARLQPGQQVLVFGASGGVGCYATQLAVAAGTEVTGVASAAKADFVRSLGATRCLDYGRAGADDDGRRYDVVIDTGGNRSLRALRRLLTPTGTAALVGGEQAGGPILAGFQRQLLAPLMSLFVRQRLTGVMSRETAEGMRRLAADVESGALRPPLDRTFALAQAAEAMTYLAQGRVRGKIALTL